MGRAPRISRVRIRTDGWTEYAGRQRRMTLRRPTIRRVASRDGGRGGFTLTELLVVIGLIVLLVTLAIPAFSIITGGRSIDSAQNQVSAILGRARADAVGLQEERGVFFYQETAGGRITAAI